MIAGRDGVCVRACVRGCGCVLVHMCVCACVRVCVRVCYRSLSLYWHVAGLDAVQFTCCTMYADSLRYWYSNGP